MLQSTFIHIPGIGRETERGMWSHGISNWDDADKFEKCFGLVGARLKTNSMSTYRSRAKP